jgi:hypothetical protein
MEAVDADHPDGTTGYKNNGYTVLQQHIAFFDRNDDGVIYPWETFQGMCRIDWLSVLTSLNVCWVHPAFSPVSASVKSFRNVMYILAKPFDVCSLYCRIPCSWIQFHNISNRHAVYPQCPELPYPRCKHSFLIRFVSLGILLLAQFST